MPWPMRWRKNGPKPASSIGLRQAALSGARVAPAPAAGASVPLAREHRREGLGVARRRLAADDRAAEVGRVARGVHRAEVEHHGLALGDRLEAVRLLRVVARG